METILFIPSRLNDLPVDVDSPAFVQGDILSYESGKFRRRGIGTVGQVPVVTDIGGGVLALRYAAPAGGGVTDHGLLDAPSLLDDDHPQYHTNARGDARYSLLGHNHDGIYSLIGHNHDATYAALAHVHSHATLTNLLADDHTQYALLAGRPAGQTLFYQPGVSVGPGSNGLLFTNTGADLFDFTFNTSPTGPHIRYENRNGQVIDGGLPDIQLGAVGLNPCPFIVNRDRVRIRPRLETIVGLTLDGMQEIRELPAGTPANPNAGYVRLYAKDVGGTAKLFAMDEAGVETQLTP